MPTSAEADAELKRGTLIFGSAGLSGLQAVSVVPLRPISKGDPHAPQTDEIIIGA